MLIVQIRGQNPRRHASAGGWAEGIGRFMLRYLYISFFSFRASYLIRGRVTLLFRSVFCHY